MIDVKKLISKLPILIIVSVIAGIATSTTLGVITHEILHLAGVFPALFKPKFDRDVLIISLIYHAVYAVIGAMVTAKVAKDKARKATFVLGTKGAIIWLLGTILLWNHAPPWFNITKAVLEPPLAWIGGKIYMTYKKKKEDAMRAENTETRFIKS